MENWAEKRRFGAAAYVARPDDEPPLVSVFFFAFLERFLEVLIGGLLLVIFMRRSLISKKLGKKMSQKAFDGMKRLHPVKVLYVGKPAGLGLLGLRW